jgi:ParB family transcriptional regulator, chromosome partitioning protein
MIKATSNRLLKNIPPNLIRANPENPRLVFRQEEMELLMLSIDKHGIQVPLTVYKDGAHFTLIDGERRWRCARKLNLRTVPVLVEKRPTELENLVLMYNIHALREQWDYYTIASKLVRIVDLYAEEHGEQPNEITLSELTGLSRGAIRRCRLLMELPDRFKDMLVVELEKPKSQQRLSEDFFLEMEKSLKTVTRRLPNYQPRIDNIRDTLIEKFRNGTISAVTDFRDLAKIATAIDTLGVAQRTANRALESVFDPKKSTSIRDAYSSTVEFVYEEQKVSRHVSSLVEFLDSLAEDDGKSNLDDELLKAFKGLYQKLRQLLKQ